MRKDISENERKILELKEQLVKELESCGETEISSILDEEDKKLEHITCLVGSAMYKFPKNAEVISLSEKLMHSISVFKAELI
jgi:hypothetical protein